MPAKEIRLAFVFSKTGKLLGEVAPAFVYQFKKGTPLYARLDSASKTKVAAFVPVMAKLQTQEINRFRQEVAHGTATVIKGGNHYVFLSHPVETEKMMRDFLK